MPSIVPLDSLLGATFIGIVVSTAIYGITCLQVYLYFTEHCTGDPPALKVFVTGLMVLDTFHVAILAHAFYSYTVTNFGDYGALGISTWSLLIQVGIGGVLGLCVQMFYVRRVYILSGKRCIIPGIITLLALARYCCTITHIVRSFSIRLFANLDRVQNWALATLSLDILCDTLITASMIYYLWRSKTTFAKTNRMINILIAYIMNTCLLTTICSAASLILFASRPGLLLYAPFYFTLVRLYSCSLMSTSVFLRMEYQVTSADVDGTSLNSRKHVRQQDGISSRGVSMGTMSVFGSASGTTASESDPPSPAKVPFRFSMGTPSDPTFNRKGTGLV